MTFKGSVVIKKIHLLNWIEDQKFIFRSDVNESSKWHVWGKQISYETLLEEEIRGYSWDKAMQAAFEMKQNNMSQGLDFVFNNVPNSGEKAK